MYCMYETTYFSTAYAATNSESVTQDTLAGPTPPQPSLVTHVYRACDFCMRIHVCAWHPLCAGKMYCMYALYVCICCICMYVCMYIFSSHA